MKLILASASWCSPCRTVKSRIESENLHNNVEIKDADEDVTFFKENNIKSIPRLLGMEGDNIKEVIQGVDDIIKRIKQG